MFETVAAVVLLVTPLAYRAALRLFERRRIRGRLAGYPALGPATAEDAIVRATGIVRATSYVTAPLSRQPCVAARVRIYPVHMRPEPYEHFEMVPFVLERDGEPPIAIASERAQLDIAPSLRMLASAERDPDGDPRNDLLSELDVAAEDRRDATFEETIIRDGDRIAIAGVVVLDPVQAEAWGERGYRDDVRDVRGTVRLVGSARHPLAISALPDVNAP